MALDFPNNPTNGQVFSGPTKSWVYESALSAWNSSSNTVVNPTTTILTGNGVLSAFSIGGADNIINPSALTVSIDGAIQTPTVNYTVANNIITFTSPVPNGSTAVVISPTNTIQVTNVVPADGSVTSAKLDNNLTVSGNLEVAGTLIANGQGILGSLTDNGVMTKRLSTEKHAVDVE